MIDAVFVIQATFSFISWCKFPGAAAGFWLWEKQALPPHSRGPVPKEAKGGPGLHLTEEGVRGSSAKLGQLSLLPQPAAPPAACDLAPREEHSGNHRQGDKKDHQPQ